MRKPVQKKYLHRVCRIASIFLVAVAIALAVLQVGARVIGLTPYVILSGSMAPEYRVGDMIYVAKIAPEEIQIGDAITFINGTTCIAVTHRVIEVNRDEGYFHSKGDANDTVDGGVVRYEDVLGVVSFSIPKVGFLFIFLSGSFGRYVSAAVFLLLILLLFVLPELFRCDNKKHNPEVEKHMG